MAGDGDDDCTDQQWGFIATSVSDPEQCITDCRVRFFSALLSKDETFDALCEVLSDKSHEDKEEALRTLYCCDSQICGVDNLIEGGLDPNVNWLINTCGSIGFTAVVDPGPPDSTYTCKRDSGEEAVHPRCARREPIDGSGAATTTAAATSAGAFDILLTDSAFATSTGKISASTSATVVALAPETTYTAIQDPSLPASLDNTIMGGDTDGHDNVSTGVGVTIALSALVAVIIVIALVACLLNLRTRAQREKGNLQGRDKASGSSSLNESQSPLVSAAASRMAPDGTPLTPPARLGDRKILSIVSLSRTSRGLHTRGDKALLRPPVCLPKRIEMVPRRDRLPRYACQARMVPTSALARGTESISSVASNPTAARSMKSVLTTHTSTSNTTTSSAASSKYRRANETPPDINGLASPGPPPTRALPCTPSSASTSPTRSVIRHGEIGIAIGTLPRSPGQVVLPQETRDLFELTEEYARETRNSWGSWGGGGPGVTTVKSTRDVSPMLQEADLERLGGRY